MYCMFHNDAFSFYINKIPHIARTDSIMPVKIKHKAMRSGDSGGSPLIFPVWAFTYTGWLYCFLLYLISQIGIYTVLISDLLIYGVVL